MSHDSSDEDDDLKRAISLSLQDSRLLLSPPPTISEVIDLISDEDTDDLDPAVAPDKMISYSPSCLDIGQSPLRKVTCESVSGQKGSAVSYNENKTDSFVIRPLAKGPEAKLPNAQTAGKPVDQNIKEFFKPPGIKEATSAISGLGALDRRKMEEERLARARKRKAVPSPPDSWRSTDKPRGSSVASSDAAEPPLKKQMLQSNSVPTEVSDQLLKVKQVHIRDKGNLNIKVASHPTHMQTTPWFLIPSQLMNSEPAMLADIECSTSGPDPTRNLAESSHAKIPEAQPSSDQQAPMGRGIQYPHGVVKQTWAYGFPRVGDIKIEEVLQKHDLDLAVLSSFQWNEEWLLSKLDMTRTKLMLVTQATNAEEVSLDLSSLSIHHPRRVECSC
jgi:hypothetical protein